jgi:predicted amidohydrolase YtcJ
MTRLHTIVVAIVVLSVVAGCSRATSSSISPSGDGSRASSPAPGVASRTGSLVILGRIVTMTDPPVVEAILIEDGAVIAVGTKDDVLAVADETIPVVDIGQNVAYPGFIDAHAHWIGDRDYYRVGSAAEAMDLALERGWTSISEQWVNQERLDELTALAADGALPLRVDAYLALNYDKEFFGDWYESRAPGPVDDWLRVRGVKVHADDGWGTTVNWEPAQLTASIGRANEAGWQVSVHTMSAAAHELVLDAFEAAIGPSGPNPLHHRIEHATQVTDEALARMVAMDLAIVIHLEGEADWILHEGFLGEFDRDDPGRDIAAEVGRWRDLVDAGLHVASATDAPWTFADDFVLEDDMARPVDQIAAGMDGRARLVRETPPWLLDQTLTAEQGLRAVTIDAAWALADESRRGHLAPGTLGDITILSGDVTDATPDEIRAMPVVATIVGGIPAYCSDREVCSQIGG